MAGIYTLIMFNEEEIIGFTNEMVFVYDKS